MADNEVVVRSVQWSRVLSIGHVFRAFRIALWPASKLFLCLAALVITVGAGLLLDLGFKTEVWGQSFGENMLNVFRFFLMGGRCHPGGFLAGTFVADWSIFGSVLFALEGLVMLIGAYWQQAFWFALLNTVIALATWTFFGGAVCRMVAMQFARDERPTIGEALKFTCKRYASLLTSPVALPLVILLIGLPVFLICAGVLAIPWLGELAAGVLFFITLAIGFIMSFLVLFSVASLGLQMPAIGAEGRDAFDAISRGVNYVFVRPWQYIIYTVVSLVYMSLTFVLVRSVAFLVLALPHGFLSIWPWLRGDGDAPGKLARIWSPPTWEVLWQPTDAGGTEGFAMVCIGIVVVGLLGLMVAFIPSFILSAQTIIYFLLRRDIDFKDLEEVYIEGDESRGGLARLESTEQTTVEPEPAASDAPKASETSPEQHEAAAESETPDERDSDEGGKTA